VDPIWAWFRATILAIRGRRCQAHRAGGYRLRINMCMCLVLVLVFHGHHASKPC